TPSCSPQAAVHARSRRGSGPPTCFINEQMGALPRAHLPPPSRIARLRLLIALGQGPQHTVWVTLKDQFTRVGYRDLVVSRVLPRLPLAPGPQLVDDGVLARGCYEAHH